MRYANKYNLSRIAVDWLLHDEYDYVEDAISATTLIKPIRATVLRERHDDELIVDVSSLIAARYGTAIHASFEETPFGGHVSQEKRLFHTIDDMRISGKYDLLHRPYGHGGKYTLKDIKSTSVWNYVFGNKTEEFKKQLSIYRYLLIKNGIPTELQADILYTFTDWSRSKAKHGGDYPPLRLADQSIELYHKDEIEQYIKDRLKAIVDARKLPDDELPFCTDDELWKQPTVYAHMRHGRKSAVKKYDTEEEALAAIKDDPKGFLEVRPGMVNRCPEYCPCHPFCNQFKQLLEDGLVEAPEEVDEIDIL